MEYQGSEGVQWYQNGLHFKFFPISVKGGSLKINFSQIQTCQNFPGGSKKLWTFSTNCDIFLMAPLGLSCSNYPGISDVPHSYILFLDTLNVYSCTRVQLHMWTAVLVCSCTCVKMYMRTAVQVYIRTAVHLMMSSLILLSVVLDCSSKEDWRKKVRCDLSYLTNIKIG